MDESSRDHSGTGMRPSADPVPIPGDGPGPSSRPTQHRRFTLLDAMVLTLAVAIGCRVGLNDLYWSFRSGWYVPQPHWTKWVRLILVRTAPFVSVVTITLLFLRLLRPRPPVPRLARQPGFVACLAASLVLLVGGCMTLTHVSGRNDSLPWRGFHVSDIFPTLASYLFQPYERAEVGFAIAASWLVLIVGRRWRPEPSWIDRLGRAVGVYWLVMIVVIRIGEPLRL